MIYLSSLLALFFLASALVYLTGSVRAEAWTQKVDPWVLATADRQGEVEFLLFLAQQADLSQAASLESKLAKGTFVYQQLTAISRQTQPAIVAELEAMGARYRQYWIANMIWVRGDRRVVEAMARRADIAHIYANPAVHLQEPHQVDAEVLAQAVQAVEWNINRVNAPGVWAQGYTGQGVVIGGQDTGYDWDHPALINQYRGWNGSSADHNYNWHDAVHTNNPITQPGNPCGFDSPEPCDDHSHGTHTMGTMVGNDLPPDQPGWPESAVNATGMAPGARWIGCRNMEEGWGTPATYSECYQWFVAPTDLSGQNPTPALAPHVISNSWGCPPVEGCTDPTVLLMVVENVRAAGIVTVHSAGNSGSGCSTIQTPAAIYDASFTVGSSDSSDNIAFSSSRGPVTVDGSGRLKPDISAPGVAIRSSVPANGYGIMSGTSMAAPHVAGAIALLISARPDLAGNVDALEAAAMHNALARTTSQGCGGDSDTSVPNNVYGWGRLDALAAYEAIAIPAPHALAVEKTAAPAVLPGALLTYTLTVTHTHPTSPTFNLVLTDTLPVGVAFITATVPHTFDGSTVRWEAASLAAGESWEVQLVVQAPSGGSDVITNANYGIRSDEVGMITGPPVTTTLIRFLNYLPVISRPGDG